MAHAVVSLGRAPVLVHGDVDARILVTRFLPGRLVLDSPAADDVSTYAQAGELLARFHGQTSVVDQEFGARENAKSLARLDEPHQIARDTESRLRQEIRSWSQPAATLVPTHGDWQPRNWLVHEGEVRVIDFGRAALRPAMSDFARLAVQDFQRSPLLEAAFVEGYGGDPREPDAWQRNRIREAIGTAAWAFRIGDEGFEAQGQRMIREALDR